MEKKTKKAIRNLFLFLLLILLTFYIIFKDSDISEIIEIVRSADKKFVLIAVGFMFLYFFCETLNVTRTLTALRRKIKFF